MKKEVKTGTAAVVIAIVLVIVIVVAVFLFKGGQKKEGMEKSPDQAPPGVMGPMKGKGGESPMGGGMKGMGGGAGMPQGGAGQTGSN